MARKSNAPQRRNQIVWALYDCLVNKGNEKVTVKEIAAQAGLPPGVIHYYFKSKDEIVSSLAIAIVEKYSNLMEHRLSNAESPGQRVEALIDFIVDALIFNRPLNRVFYNLVQLTFERDELGEVIRDMFRNYRERLTRVFTEAGAKNESKMLGAAIVAVTEGFSVQLMVDPRAFKKADVRQIISRAVKDRLPNTMGAKNAV